MTHGLRRTFSFHHETSGLFHTKKFCGPIEDLQLNCPDGYVAIEGNFDPSSQRRDIANGVVVSYQPPRPGDEHEWSADIKRWVLKPEIDERNKRIASAREQLRALDASETRAVSDVLADPNDQQAKDRLAAVRAQKQALRDQLK